jgi:hypothetical protein
MSKARIHQDRAELRILPGGDGHVPAVDEHVDETVTGVYGAKDRAVGDSARRLERARDGEYGGRRLCRGVVCGERVCAEQIAVEVIADLADGRAGGELGSPQIASYHVVDQRPDIPPLARRWCRPLALTDSSYDPSGGIKRPAVQFSDVHDGPPLACLAGVVATPWSRPIAVVADGSRSGDQVPEGIVLAVAAIGLAAAGEGRGQRLAGGRLAGVLDSQPGRP